MKEISEQITILKELYAQLEDHYYFKPKILFSVFEDLGLSLKQFYDLLRKTGCKKYSRDNRVWKRPIKTWSLGRLFKTIKRFPER